MVSVRAHGFKRVTKTTAKKMHSEGRTIFMLPSKVPLGSPWFKPIELDNNKEFERYSNEFRYYNCNKETGREIRYFIQEA